MSDVNAGGLSHIGVPVLRERISRAVRTLSLTAPAASELPERQPANHNERQHESDKSSFLGKPAAGLRGAEHRCGK
ncbi:MAG: hypothetical protein ABIO94_02830 [Opitutaceae bacterium]